MDIFYCNGAIVKKYDWEIVEYDNHFQQQACINKLFIINEELHDLLIDRFGRWLEDVIFTISNWNVYSCVATISLVVVQDLYEDMYLCPEIKFHREEIFSLGELQLEEGAVIFPDLELEVLVFVCSIMLAKRLNKCPMTIDINQPALA